MTTSSARTASPLQPPHHPASPPASEPVAGTGSVAANERRCLNCGAPLDTPFCAQCGQRDVEPTLAVRDFVHELVAEHFGLDSKVARTLIALVRWPGRLTNEFIRGRRVRYVPPLRLYLSLSVLFFLLSALSEHARPGNGKGMIEEGGGIVRIDTTSGGRRVVHVSDSTKSGTTISMSNSKFLSDTVHSSAAARWFKRRMSARIADLRANGKTAATQIGAEFQRELPDAVFLLVPMVALMLGVVYFGQRRYYAEHLVFALHFQAFVFAALIVAMLPIPFIDLAVWLGGIAYAYLALRTVYAEGKGTTVLKLGVLGVGYAISAVIIMALLGFIVFFFG